MRNVTAALPKPSASALRAHDAASFVARNIPEYGPEFVQYAVVGERLLHGGCFGQRAGNGPNHGPDRNAILLAKFEVALIVRGHGHDRARAVTHQHEIADPDGNLLAAERIDGIVRRWASLPSRCRPALWTRAHRSSASLAPSRSADDELSNQRMLGRQNHACRAVDCVHARGEHADRLAGALRAENRSPRLPTARSNCAASPARARASRPPAP